MAQIKKEVRDHYEALIRHIYDITGPDKPQYPDKIVKHDTICSIVKKIKQIDIEIEESRSRCLTRC